MYTLQLTFQSYKPFQNLQKKLIQIFKKLKITKFKSNKIKISGQINIKKKKKIFTVLKSPHVNKKSREHFRFEMFKQTFLINSNNFYFLFFILLIIKKIFSSNILLVSSIHKKCL